MGIVLKGITAALGEALVLKRVDIRIEGNTIETVSESPLEAKEGYETIQGEGKLAIPGLVNAHTHLPMVLFRGAADDLPLSQWLSEYIWPREARLTEDEIYWGALLGLAEMIRSGTTLFSDMYFHLDAIGRAVAESGMRALLSYGIIAPRLDEKGKQELERTEWTITHLHDTVDGRIRIAVAPHSVYTCGKDVWEMAVKLARKYEVPIHTHIAETRDEVADCYVRDGVSPVELLERWGALSGPVIAAHCVHVSPADIEILKARGVSVVHCPKSNAKLGSGTAPVARMSEAGVNVALGTDGAASNNSLNMIAELRFASLAAKAVNENPMLIPAKDALRMASAVGATALGSGDTGKIEEGCRADIVLLDIEMLETLPMYDPISALVYSAGREAVSDVMVDGRFLMRERTLTTIDEDRVKYEVKRIANRYRNQTHPHLGGREIPRADAGVEGGTDGTYHGEEKRVDPDLRVE